MLRMLRMPSGRDVVESGAVVQDDDVGLVFVLDYLE
jgi:hypothetical protein